MPQITGKLGAYKTSDGKKFERKAFANNHQRAINASIAIGKMVKKLGVGSDVLAFSKAVRSKPKLRAAFFRALNY